jgi:hypothetical protein
MGRKHHQRTPCPDERKPCDIRQGIQGRIQPEENRQGPLWRPSCGGMPTGLDRDHPPTLGKYGQTQTTWGRRLWPLVQGLPYRTGPVAQDRKIREFRSLKPQEAGIGVWLQSSPGRKPTK